MAEATDLAVCLAVPGLPPPTVTLVVSLDVTASCQSTAVLLSREKVVVGKYGFVDESQYEALNCTTGGRFAGLDHLAKHPDA